MDHGRKLESTVQQYFHRKTLTINLIQFGTVYCGKLQWYGNITFLELSVKIGVLFGIYTSYSRNMPPQKICLKKCAKGGGGWWKEQENLVRLKSI